MLRIVWLLALGAVAGFAAEAPELPPLPRGIAGQFVGTIGDWLAAAGGTWWTAPPSEGGKKIWTDRILVLAPGAREWREAGRLPAGLGYGGAVSVKGALLVLGGQTDSGVVRSAYRLVRKGEAVVVEPLPDLPEPAAFTAAAAAGGRIYLLAGQRANDADRAEASVWSLEAGLRAWRKEPDLPAEGRILPAAAACGDTLYLASGAALFRDGSEVRRRYLKDAWRFRAGIGWQRMPDLPAPAVAAPAVCADGPVLFGGDDGSMVGRVFTPPARHPGFARKALRFDGKRWVEAGELAVGLVTTGAVERNGKAVIAGGEDRPGSRSPRVLPVTLEGSGR